jgi:hypothetical protein
MHPLRKIALQYVIRTAAAGLLSTCWLAPAFAGGPTDGAVDTADAAARDFWRANMARNPSSAEGCFHAAYPSFVWERVDCKSGQPRVHPYPRSATSEAEDVTGNGHDYVAKASGLITETLGLFASVTGVTSEKSVGVAIFGGGGILGPNEYSLQLNSNANKTTSACAHHSGCKVWQQFLYSTDYLTVGEAEVYIQYWLIGWGSSACPSVAWISDGAGDCYKNSAYVAAPDMPITELGSLTLSGASAAGGNDTVTFNNGAEAYSVTAKDSVLHLGSVWTESEFNVVGDAGGSRADFNKGTSVTVNVVVADGSSSAPKCVANAGTTGETNNLNLGACTSTGGFLPAIEFTETH